ncbi:uncharacterized protein LOC111696721 [Eurytemora carolleeae]|uniref:uncharacterized protein LOC111696721 n=1 Tax=Eurytemora carolleeae TaxID=1294199 RepID=UPI000C78478B|nr:uncharacterized protein LOC111696721 [Eurytemora carolleeae]|eukprot:XP_023322196.1 uncharacterized protein LOC111696721 [Eurytemora affinis]
MVYIVEIPYRQPRQTRIHMMRRYSEQDESREVSHTFRHHSLSLTRRYHRFKNSLMNITTPMLFTIIFCLLLFVLLDHKEASRRESAWLTKDKDIKEHPEHRCGYNFLTDRGQPQRCNTRSENYQGFQGFHHINIKGNAHA